MRTKLIVSMALLSIFALAGCGSESASTGNQLSSLALSDGTLTPAFDPATTAYAVEVANSVSSVMVTPKAKDSGATIKVNTVDVESGKASGSIDIPSTITITVTPKDGGATYTYTITVTHAALGVKDIGSPCHCDGGNCLIQGVPFPPGTPGGQITGCENVTTSIPIGAVLMCLRSFDGQGSIPTTYFANGYCSLGSTDCTGNAFCVISTFGTYDSMTSCPAGSVLITDSTPTAGTVLDGATLKTKVCAKSCINDDDCRTTETDDKFGGAPTQYKCSDFNSSDKCNGNTYKFCYDARNLTNNCVVTKF